MLAIATMLAGIAASDLMGPEPVSVDRWKWTISLGSAIFGENGRAKMYLSLAASLVAIEIYERYKRGK
ncbi:hypothetical protein OPU71_13305 [Niveibacterium sp. 24ML]|uniref:hypothetical protein n=1 Tax=Niveibacterium sp. 24ML TaxID=2985512 RepID=UPI00226E0EA5|nr:hypothetical protein [Niveibacterium sp. 24ML]MCX9157104.1 hypothetical protein [Niveibacterium sp. 24ML]